MSSEDRIDKPEKPWRPTKEFLTSTPRSTEIRGVCLGIVRKLDLLLHDARVAESDTLKRDLYSEIELLGGKLIDLGITPNMHIDSPINSLQVNPVVASEYVAGQLIKETGANVESESDVKPFIEELRETHIDQMSVIEGGVPQRLQDFTYLRSIVNLGYQFLDAEPDDASPQQ